ncbi:flagellar biosynthetic protein FliP [Halanaerobium congolense]|jgi:flagellar biosynthetic protein FliP|uniref:Flagellar biosynthetic protein FliP n=1 Tax=Halanaerobium congolense TaxID=54121 RepID=A0A1G6S4V5_9FIRM|nr:MULTISPECIES: flagellar type III secretion system pore protein FliP [Halanaerobium]KXS49952.1 MAG: flagellar biosynthetic protein FliP [Halanaerobium sp. T82-1]OEG61769.1 MAG: flagellar biosynthetic protein FliP [Halanaerobium sp. MDAL1]PUU92307.1 MAG: flagellar biosynthetic protein FliP [Halanaerobium sp.]PUU92494.1 MAG: Flagellar biosynthesis protein FliP [Halanaerobium sp.]TDP26337.1 flagellar biosynthetic protein FliP [Halanaerobium congolense]
MNKSLILTVFIILLIFSPIFTAAVSAQNFNIPDISFEISNNDAQNNEGEDLVLSLRILLLLTVLSLAPAIIVLFTSFTRIIIVFSILKRALSLNNMPPNQVLIGIAIFLTIFIMAPVLQGINQDALQPYLNEEISLENAYENTITPIRSFMFKQVDERSLSLFAEMAEIDRPESRQDLPTYVLIPAFLINEIKIAFQIGFLLYIPFLMIDMIVASILMSMGMMMLPPVIISLPFKILLFVLADGWHLLIGSLVETFN